MKSWLHNMSRVRFFRWPWEHRLVGRPAALWHPKRTFCRWPTFRRSGVAGGCPGRVPLGGVTSMDTNDGTIRCIHWICRCVDFQRWLVWQHINRCGMGCGMKAVCDVWLLAMLGIRIDHRFLERVQGMPYAQSIGCHGWWKGGVLQNPNWINQYKVRANVLFLDLVFLEITKVFRDYIC